jgi:SMC interacting uncharacterized protein involved in chromosome segregation
LPEADFLQLSRTGVLVGSRYLKNLKSRAIFVHGDYEKMDGAMEEIGVIAAAGDTLHDAQRDIRQLKETIAALRDELEAQAHEKGRAVQEAAATADNEIHQLRQTATVLREELEALQFEKEKMVQEAVSMGLDEIGQLKRTISALREELETQTFKHQQKVQDMSLTSRNEIVQLQQTIVSLRRELEGRSTTTTEDRNG